MDDITNQALDIVFNNDAVKTKVKKAKPYIAGVALFQIVLLLAVLFLIFQVVSLKNVISRIGGLGGVGSLGGLGNR